jgi:hypothetical protein
MTEGNEATENAAAQEQVVQAVQAPNNVLAALGGLISDDTAKELGKIGGGQPAEEKPAAATTETKEEKPANAAEDNNGGEGDQKPTDTKEEKPETKEVKNVFGIGKKKGKESSIVIESPDHILETVKSKFGIEAKDIKDLPKFFESAEKWRADSQKVEEVSTKVEQYENLLSGLPQEIINSMELFYNAQDYMQAFKDKPKFNFDVTADKQDIKELVKHYFPNKFTDEDFAEEEKSQALDIATQASIDKFNLEKQTRDNQRAKAAEAATKQVELLKSSVNSSVSNLKQTFPDIDTNELKNIQKTLEGGQNAIVQMFLNQDGTVKANAAEALMMAIHGKSVIDEMMTVASHATETRVNEELLSRGNETRKPKNTAGAQEQISESAKEVLKGLSGIKTQKTFG